MINQFQKSVLIMALYAGEIMMKSGAEIYRVEDTIVRICKACKIPYVECFATTTGIFLSLDSGNSDGDMHTFIKRIKHININLSRISKLNEFSRIFTTTDLSVMDGFNKLRAIAAEKTYNLPMNVFAAMLVGAFLCPVFGGAPIDMLFASITAGTIYLLSKFISKLQFIAFVRVFICCSACALIALIFMSMGVLVTLSPVIIAAMTLFMPGVAITNAARDILSGDMLSGTARFVEAFMIAIGIAGGVGVVISFWALGGNPIEYGDAHYYPIYVMFLFSICSTCGFSIMFNVPLKQIPIVAIIGGCGMTVRELALAHDQIGIVACFLGACTVAVLAEFGSRAGKDPTTVFIIPGIIPLVPGTLLYSATHAMLTGEITKAAEDGVQTILYAGAIAVALVMVASITRILVYIIRNIRKRFSNSKESS